MDSRRAAIESIAELLDARFWHSCAIGIIKKRKNLPSLDPSRETGVRELWMNRNRALPTQGIESVLSSLLMCSRRIQERIREQQETDSYWSEVQAHFGNADGFQNTIKWHREKIGQLDAKIVTVLNELASSKDAKPDSNGTLSCAYDVDEFAKPRWKDEITHVINDLARNLT